MSVIGKTLVFIFIFGSISSWSRKSVSQQEQESPVSSDVAEAVIVGMAECCAENSWPEVEKAIIAELSALGWRVRVVQIRENTTETGRLDFGELATRYHANCAIRIVRSKPEDGGTVDIWINDILNEKTVMKSIPLPSGGSGDEILMIALETVEVLRAALLELKLHELNEEERGSIPQPVENLLDGIDVTKEPTLAPRWTVALSVGVLGSPGNADPLGASGLLVGFSPVDHFSLTIDGLVSVFGGEITQMGTGSSFDLAIVRAFIYWDIRTTGRLRPSLGVGFGGVFFWATGHGQDTYIGQDGSGNVYTVGASGKLRLAFNRRVCLVADARVSMLLPEIEIVFADTVAASFGRPLMEFHIGLEFSL